MQSHTEQEDFKSNTELHTLLKALSDAGRVRNFTRLRRFTLQFRRLNGENGIISFELIKLRMQNGIKSTGLIQLSMQNEKSRLENFALISDALPLR